MSLLHPNALAFLVVAELGSVSGAARRLRLTQTGVTQRILGLERELSVSLFTRSRTGMRLTAEGQLFLRLCLDARHLESRVAAAFGGPGLREEIPVTLTGPASLIGGRVAAQCRPIFDRWPRLNLRLLIEPFTRRLLLLKQGLADLAILQAQELSPELDSKLLAPLEYILLGSARWKGRKLDDILATERLYAYGEQDKLGLDYLDAHGLLGKLVRARLYANEDQVLQTQLCLGVGFGLLPKELAAPLIRSGALIPLHAGRSLKVKMALAWYPRKEMPDYFRELIASIR